MGDGDRETALLAWADRRRSMTKEGQRWMNLTFSENLEKVAERTQDALLSRVAVDHVYF